MPSDNTYDSFSERVAELEAENQQLRKAVGRAAEKMTDVKLVELARDFAAKRALYLAERERAPGLAATWNARYAEGDARSRLLNELEEAALRDPDAFAAALVKAFEPPAHAD